MLKTTTSLIARPILNSFILRDNGYAIMAVINTVQMVPTTVIITELAKDRHSCLNLAKYK